MEANRLAREDHEDITGGAIQNEGRVGKVSSLCLVISCEFPEKVAEMTMG
jgi:hypothetical protein